MPQPAPTVSKAAVDLIVGQEVTSQAAYERELEAPTWPGGASGITIGIGYDIGYVSSADFTADWSGLLPVSVMARLRNCVGVTGSQARALLSSLSDIRIPWEAALSNFEHAALPRTVLATIRTFPASVFLSPDSFGALVSLVYNRGTDISDTPWRREMHQIAGAIQDGNVAAVPPLIRQMKQIWEDDDGHPLPGFAGLVTRRELEADLFDRGLEETYDEIAFEPTTAPDSLSALRARADQLDAAIEAATRTAAP